MESISLRLNRETNWIEGKSGKYKFIAKHYDEGSEFGINNGRTSKLWVTDKNGQCVANYDRGWDVKPATKELEQIVDDIVSLLETLPKRFSE